MFCVGVKNLIIRLIEKRKSLEAEGKPLGELEDLLERTWEKSFEKWEKREKRVREEYHFDDPTKYEVDDPKSLRRKLDRKLVLLVKQRFFREDYSSPWILPQLKNNGEPLREVC